MTYGYEYEDEYVDDDDFQDRLATLEAILGTDDGEYAYVYEDPEEEEAEALLAELEAQEEAFEYELAASAAQLQSALGRKLSQAEVTGMVQSAEKLGTVDAVAAYAEYSGAQGGGTQSAEQAAYRKQVAQAVGAPSTSDPEGRAQLFAQYAEEEQAKAEAREAEEEEE
jgi:hypothetical protein